MKPLLVLITLVLVALVGVTLVPDVQEFHFHATLAALALAALLLIVIIFTPVGRAAAPEREPERAKAEAITPAAAPPPGNQAEAEVVSFLATLQDRGRLVDFLMDDVSAYGDAQVGAAARVVHEGCRAVLREHFDIEPIRTEREGAMITVPEDYRADAYRLVGKVSGEPPFAGRLVHRGWKTKTIKLPRVLRPGDDRLPAIAPAEVEVQ